MTSLVKKTIGYCPFLLGFFSASNDIEEGGSDRATNGRAVERRRGREETVGEMEWTRGVGVLKGKK